MEYSLIITISLIVSAYVIFLLVKTWIKKDEKRKRLITPATFILIGIVLKLFFNFDRIKGNLDVVNTIFYLLISFAFVLIVDYIFKEKYVPKKKIRIPKLIHDIIFGSIYLILFFAILRAELGIDLAPILTTSAVVSMVVGLAVQDTLSNFIAGIVLHVETPFKFGDWVLVNNIEGKIVEINWRTVKLLTFENDFLIIPNSNIVKDSIINFNYPTSNHILILNIGTSYEDRPNHVKQALLETARGMDSILKAPKPVVRLIKYNDFSIDYEVRAWIKDYGKKKIIENEFMTKLWYIFKREGIKIPFPIRDVYIRKSEERKEEDEIKENLLALKQIYLFENMPENVQNEIARKAYRVMYAKDEVVFWQGDTGDSFFVILNGEVSVQINGVEIAKLKKGNFMGEMSLFTGKERNATAISTTDSKFLVLNREKFSDILLEHKEIAEEISSIIAEREIANKKYLNNKKTNETKKTEEKYEEESKKRSILNSITKIFNLKN